MMICFHGGSTHHLEVTAGGFWRTLPSTITYEATIPMVYETIWREKEVRGGSPFKGVCENLDNRNPNCIILNSLNQLKVSYEKEFDSLARSWSPSYLKNCSEPKGRSKRALDFLGEGLSWCCGVATQHKLDSLTMSEQNLKLKLSKLTQGISKSFSTISQNSKKFMEYEKSVANTFKSTEDRIHKLESYTEQVTNSVTEFEKEESYFLLSVLNNQFENLRHIIEVTRALKRQGIINSCRQHQIPISILDPAVLRHDLEKLEGELAKLGQKLAVPLHDLSKLYQVPICDCGFNGDKVFINIRIPVVQMGQSWELFELITTPFAWENQTCIIKHEPLFLAVSKSPLISRSYVRQISGSGLRHCQPFNDRLCYLPRFSADMMQGPACAKKLYNGASVEEISHHCPMSCHKSTTTVVSEIAEETYVITHPKNETKLICNNLTQSLDESAYIMPGSIKVYLPCHCEFAMEGEVLIPRRFPCLESFPLESTMTHIIPAAWSTLKSFVLKPNNQDNLPKFLRPEDGLNKNWTLEIPHLNLTSPKANIREILDSVDATVKLSYADMYGQHGDAIFFIWNCILSIAICYIFFGGRHNLAIIPALAAPARAESKSHLEHDIYFAFLCMGLGIFIIYFGLKIYFLMRRNKSRGVENPKPAKRQAPPLNQPLSSRRQFILQMSSDVDLNSLEPGHSLECVLQGVENSAIKGTSAESGV